MRQRKKFLSVLMSDGRAKSSNNTNVTSNKPYNGASSTLNRSQSSVNQKTPQRERYINGHESDQPSYTSSRNGPMKVRKKRVFRVVRENLGSCCDHCDIGQFLSIV